MKEEFTKITLTMDDNGFRMHGNTSTDIESLIKLCAGTVLALTRYARCESEEMLDLIDSEVDDLQARTLSYKATVEEAK